MTRTPDPLLDEGPFNALWPLTAANTAHTVIATQQGPMSSPLRFNFGTPVRHADKIHSCKHCERVTIDSHDLRSWIENGVLITLPHSKGEARLAARDQCPLFEHLATLFSPAVSRKELWRVLKICIEGRQKYFDVDHLLKIPTPLGTRPSDMSQNLMRIRIKLLTYVLRTLLLRQLYLVFDRKELRIYWLMRCKQMKLSGTDEFPNMIPVVRYNVTAAEGEYCESF